MRRSITVLAALAATVVLAGTALAAAPKKGGVYEGMLHSSATVALGKKVRLVVAKTGKSARVLWWCGTGRQPNTLVVQIAPDGTFKGTSNVGTLTVWLVKGRVLTATKVRMALQIMATCDGKGGTVNLALKA